jgi:hypothetical protein
VSEHGAIPQRLLTPRGVTIAQLIRAHTHVAEQLDPSVPNQNDWRFALLGVVAEIGEVLTVLPWRPWRGADSNEIGTAHIDAALPELVDVVSAALRAVANLGIDPERFERACVDHIRIKHERIYSGQDR